MTGYPKNFPSSSGIQIGIIAGGDINDPASDHSCNQKVYCPLEHSPDGVKLDHLAFSPMSHSPTNHSQQMFPGVMDPGTLVYVLKTTGQNQVTILGQANDFNNSGKNRTPGNMDLMNNPIILELLNRTIGILIPPDIEEIIVKGAKVKVPKEKDKEHSHNLLQGLPTHGAMFTMAGYRLPQVKNIPTALQHFNELLTEDDMAKMPGDPMSFGKMFQGLLSSGRGGGGGSGSGGGGGSSGRSGSGVVTTTPVSGNTSNVVASISVMSAAEILDAKALSPDAESDIPFERILARLPDPKLGDALINMAILIQGDESYGESAYSTGQRVHMETFLTNAEEMLSQVTSIADLIDVLEELMWNEDLYGLDKLDPVEIAVDLLLGEAKRIIYPNGSIGIEYSANVKNLDNSFANVVTSGITTYGGQPSGGGSGGGGGGGAPSASGQNMFGDMGSKLMDMFKRVSPEAEKKRREVIEKVNTSEDATKNQNILEAFIKGKNPISPDLLK